MIAQSTESLRIKAKLLQKAKRRAGQPVALKDALASVARVAGYPSWRALKAAFDDADLVCPPQGSSAHAKTWYARHDDARIHMESGNDLYLIPYRNQFFVCEASWLDGIGLAASDPDVRLVGRDWSRPEDGAAWARLLTRLRARRPSLR